MIRTFIALPIHGLPSLTGWCNRMKAAFPPPGVRWVLPEHRHLTLRFIGGVDTPTLKALTQALAETLTGVEGGTINVKGTGYFGPAGRPKVIWAGIEADDCLLRLYDAVQEAAIMAGQKPDDRDFNPHLTLARVKNPRAIQPLMEAMEERRDFVWGRHEANRVILYRSDATRDGPLYSVLTEYLLS